MSEQVQKPRYLWGAKAIGADIDVVVRHGID